jgi:uncharacterized protein YheU (UPF0270 family)
MSSSFDSIAGRTGFRVRPAAHKRSLRTGRWGKALPGTPVASLVACPADHHAGPAGTFNRMQNPTLTSLVKHFVSRERIMVTDIDRRLKRVKEYKQRQLARGMIQVQVWVPTKADADRIKWIAALMREQIADGIP